MQLPGPRFLLARANPQLRGSRAPFSGGAPSTIAKPGPPGEASGWPGPSLQPESLPKDRPGWPAT
eukprot:11336572-Alexandrium_andersonii.AAC.1